LPGLRVCPLGLVSLQCWGVAKTLQCRCWAMHWCDAACEGSTPSTGVVVGHDFAYIVAATGVVVGHDFAFFMAATGVVVDRNSLLIFEASTRAS
jgi:hypothetical protein